MDAQNAVGVPGPVAGLVEYQAGSIVSRVLVRRRGGSVSLFAFDAGQELSEHSAPFDALVQVIEGAATITLAAQAFKVSAGELILMPANIPHAIKAVERFKMVLTMVKD